MKERMEARSSRTISATLNTVPIGKYQRVQTDVMSKATPPDKAAKLKAYCGTKPKNPDNDVQALDDGAARLETQSGNNPRPRTKLTSRRSRARSDIVSNDARTRAIENEPPADEKCDRKDRQS